MQDTPAEQQGGSGGRKDRRSRMWHQARYHVGNWNLILWQDWKICDTLQALHPERQGWLVSHQPLRAIAVPLQAMGTSIVPETVSGLLSEAESLGLCSNKCELLLHFLQALFSCLLDTNCLAVQLPTERHGSLFLPFKLISSLIL